MFYRCIIFQMQAGWLVLLALFILAAAYEGSGEPDAAFDTRITQMYKSSCGTKIIMEMEQSIPFEYTYQEREIPYSYRILIECVNSKILKFYLTDSVHPIFRMDESDPFPNINNLEEKMQDEIHQYQKTTYDKELKLPYCSASIQVHQRSCYVQIDITHHGNTVRLTGFRVEKRILFFHMRLPTDYLLGLGERNGKFKIDTGRYTLWAKDNLFAIQRDDFCQNTYGYHPMMLYRDRHRAEYEVIYIRSTSALEVAIQNRGEDKILLTQLHGNSLQMLFFQNKTAKGALESYHEYIGKFKLPPLWFFGFHQSRWGYQSATKLQKVVDGYRDEGLKLESIFLDIDYMLNKKPFKIDITNFPYLQLLNLKRKSEIKLVPIVDYAFNYDFESDIDYDLRSQINSTTKIQNLFIKNFEGNLCIGEVWPGVSIFPDFYHPHISNLWKPYLSFLRQHIPFDGLWLDMNQIANFHKNPSEHVDYKDTYLQCGELLSNMTLPISARHYNDQPEFYMHNINGIKQQQVTEDIAKNIFGNQFYFISRNTFPGSGKYGGHWSGDNQAKWEYLDYSVSSLLNFNLFGIPFSGSDVCGFFGDYEQKLCSRWIQVNTLFPLFRNHNHINFKDQQFFKIGPVVSKSIKLAMNLRYSLLKYIYNIFVQRNGKGVVYYPMVFDYPQHYRKLSQPQILQSQVMIGPNLFFALKQDIYIPPGSTWYSIKEGYPVVTFEGSIRQFTEKSDVESEQNIFVKEGVIVLTQQADNVSKVHELGNKYTLHCYMNEAHECYTVYHDQAARQAGLCNNSFDCSYQIIGRVNMLSHLPNITHIQFQLKNLNDHASIFRLYIHKVRIYGRHLLEVDDENCVAMQIMDPYTKNRSCRVDQMYNIMEMRKHQIRLPYILSQVKALRFQFV